MATFPPVAEITLTDEHFEVVGDLALAYGKYTLTFGVEGVPADTGSYMDIRKRQADGSWAYVADIFNSDLPAPAAAPAP
jgi:ketosteroid isomerase-like protein